MVLFTREPTLCAAAFQVGRARAQRDGPPLGSFTGRLNTSHLLLVLVGGPAPPWSGALLVDTPADPSHERTPEYAQDTKNGGLPDRGRRGRRRGGSGHGGRGDHRPGGGRPSPNGRLLAGFWAVSGRLEP